MGNGVVVLSGPPCSGKSEVARLLSSHWSTTGRHCIEVDAVFTMLLPGSDRNSADRMLAYDAAHAVARALLDRGHTPILECTYSRRTQRAALVQAIADLPATPLWVVEFSVSPDEAVRRFRQSAAHRATDLTEHLVRERAATFPYTDRALRLRDDDASPATRAREISGWIHREPDPVDRNTWAAAGKD
ncbi:AAA family ATPase [Flexivirga caeni]|uniref:AAA family ATPase n=1 Tax=Flexivirga caeni TaxID=2294115 RepID=UPI0013159690|nr:AAA family ATPase [Flexivirga caeni]